MSDWIESWSDEEAKHFLTDVSVLLSELGGPLTKALSKLVEEKRFVELVNYQFDYSADFSVRDFTLARQIHALFHKQEWMDLGLEPQKKAEQKFWEMEKRCSVTNESIDSCRLSADVWRVIHLARREIKRNLGGVPSVERLKISFGPGATTNVKGRVASPRAKLNARLACSRDMLPVVGRFLAEAPLWAWHQSGLPCGGWEKLPDSETDLLIYPDVEVHPGKLTYVPKDARTMRPIVVEPILNGFIQKGVGNYMKSRMLLKSNLDLTDQTRNQGLAMKGSIDGSLATIDLSSASDTVSWSVVRLLLPEPWFEFLAELRTGEVLDDRKVVELNKFSSMGNGFTFELESLLFYSLTKACAELLNVEGDISTFGDDIICPTQVYTLLAEVLTELGFLVNSEKSFTAGPFRESCGADWFKGKSIRPYYGKKPWCERTLYTFHNFAVRNCEHELAAFLLSRTNPTLRLFGPDGYGDGHLVGSYNLRQNRKLKRNGWEGGFFDTYSLRPRRLKKRYDSDWVYPSYSVYTRSGERTETDPDIVRGSDGYAKVSLYTLASTVFGRSSAPNGAAQLEGDFTS
jgi:hypothetical protein